MTKGKKLSENHKKKLSLAHKGKKLSEEHKKNISNSNIGRHKGMTLEKRYGEEKAGKVKKKISLSLMGNVPWNKGKTNIYSKETLKSNSNSHKGQVPWNKGKKGEEYKLHYKNGGLNPPSNLGKPHTEETKRKIGLGHKGIRHSEESKRKMSQSQKGHFPYRKGKHHTEEAKEKIRKARAKQVVPKKDTKIEVKIQEYLKQLDIEFFTHQYMKIEHGYQCDILIPSINLVIECDGDYWHNYPIGNKKDHIRTLELIEKGFRVLRLWEREIKDLSLIQFKDKLEEIIKYQIK